jgi:uncharacterized membrane protein
MSQGDYILVLVVLGGLLSAATGLGMQRVGPNRWYGVRTSATYADRRVWRDANRRSGRGLISLGLAAGAFSLLLLALPGDMWVLGVGALLGGMLVWAISSVWYASERRAYYERLDRGLAAEEIQREQ